MVLAGVAAPGLAATVDRENLAQCKSQLKRVYGEETRMKLKSIKRSRNGNQMRIQTIVPGAKSEMITCWVDHDGVANMQDHDGVALVFPEFDSADKVSQSN
jgi:hypothetical protein